MNRIYRFGFYGISEISAPSVAIALRFARHQRLFGAEYYSGSRDKKQHYSVSSVVVEGSEVVTLLSDPLLRCFTAHTTYLGKGPLR